VRSKPILAALGVYVSAFALAFAGVPASKRTILTSGESVHSVRFQLGQSTLLYFGFKPETVLCGNKNYFNIEKFKDGITIQPLSNFSTNLTVIDGQRRFLFYLVPSGANAPDGFIDVKWVNPTDARPVKPSNTTNEVVRPLGQAVNLASDLELRLTSQKSFPPSTRQIVELNIRNLTNRKIRMSEIEVLALDEKLPSPGQVTIWEKDLLKPHEGISGRTIFNSKPGKQLNLAVGYKQKTIKVLLSKGRH
jgi:hypothetical protein